MKIRDIEGYQLALPPGSYQWPHAVGPARDKRDAFLVRVITDDGPEGHCITVSSGHIIASVLENTIKPIAVGANPFERERLWQKLMQLSRPVQYNVFGISAFDVALWDLAAKKADLPLYEFIGAYRNRIPVYASTHTFDTLEEYRNNVVEYVKQGYRAIKLHVYGDPKKDIETCKIVRDAVGPDIVLMMDAAGAYNQTDALWVGRQLEKLDFRWFEEPVRDYDLL